MEIEAGSVIDRFVVDELLGKGGMAAVYRVRHATLDAHFALKLLYNISPSVKQRLLREGKVQARLRHPNVVSVVDVLQVGDSPGLVMEYVDGPTLDDWANLTDPDLATLEAMFLQILDGVSAAHEIGIVHRDLKPSNILVERSRGVPKVSDFGLATALEPDEPRATRTGTAMGTPGYMAPEQIQDARDVDERADVFSLGCILYELVCGVVPFKGDSLIEVMNAVLEGRFVPPSQRVRDLPERFEMAIGGALMGDRDKRIPSCEALREVLLGERLFRIASEPAITRTFEHASPASPSFPTAPEIPEHDHDHDHVPSEPPAVPKRRPWPPLAAVAVVGVLAVAWWALGRPDHQPESTLPAPEPTPEAEIEEPLPEAETVELPSATPAPEPEQPAPEPVQPKPAPQSATREPAPAEPEPARSSPTAPTAMARLSYEGAEVLWLETGGRRFEPGTVPPGSYVIHARFTGGSEHPAGELVLEAGGAVHLVCLPNFEICQPR